MKTETSQFLKASRKKAKVTQLQIAAHLGLENPQFVSLMENGHSKMPIKLINKYCEVLRIDPKQLKKVLINDYERGLNDIIENANSKGTRSSGPITLDSKAKSVAAGRSYRARF